MADGSGADGRGIAPIVIVRLRSPCRHGLGHFPAGRRGGISAGHSGEDYATSAAVYQEILHRYAAIDRRSAAEDTFRLLDAMVRSVFPIARDDIATARAVAARYLMVSARDCLHLAPMEAPRIRRILTFDRGFSAYPGVTCLPM